MLLSGATASADAGYRHSLVRIRTWGHRAKCACCCAVQLQRRKQAGAACSRRLVNTGADAVLLLTQVQHSHCAIALKQALGDVAGEVVAGDVKVQQFALHRGQWQVNELHKSRSSPEQLSCSWCHLLRNTVPQTYAGT